MSVYKNYHVFNFVLPNLISQLCQHVETISHVQKFMENFHKLTEYKLSSFQTEDIDDISRLTVVSCKAKEEVPRDETYEYFTRTNLVKIKNAITDKL